MNLLHLPLELFRQILISALEIRGAKRGLRLRLVNKLFDREVVDALLRSTLLDESFRVLSMESECPLPPFATTYLQRRVSNEPSNGNRKLVHIRKTSELLHSASPGLRDKGDYLEQLCRLAMDSAHKGRAFSIFDPERDISPTDIEKEICMAAWATNVAPIVEEWLAEGKKLPLVSWFSGFLSEHFPTYANLSAMNSLLVAKNSIATNAKRLKRLREAAQAGSIQAVKYIWDFNTDRFPWDFGMGRWPPGYITQRAIRSMITPSPEVLDFLLEKQREHCTNINIKSRDYTKSLQDCAFRGWHETAERYIQLGAAVDGLEYSGKHNRPLVYACRKGHEEVVRLLLAHGADTSAPALASAAEIGRLSIVRTLLEQGAEIGDSVLRALGKGYMDVVEELVRCGATINNDVAHLLVFAVKREHTSMFHFLCQRVQRPITPEILAKCKDVAKEQGLESMLELLQELDKDR